MLSAKIPSLLTDGVEADSLYPPRDLPAATRLTRALLTDDALNTRVGTAARQSIEERNWIHAVGRVREIYAEAIRSGRGPARWNWRDRLIQAATFGIVSAFRSMPGKREGSKWQPDLNVADSKAPATAA